MSLLFPYRTTNETFPEQEELETTSAIDSHGTQKKRRHQNETPHSRT